MFFFSGSRRSITAPGDRSFNRAIRIRAMKCNWGACRSCTGDVVLHRCLAAEPPRAIKYLVLHEHAHLIEPSHGLRFQAIRTEYMPDWRDVETALNGRVTTRG